MDVGAVDVFLIPHPLDLLFHPAPLLSFAVFLTTSTFLPIPIMALESAENPSCGLQDHSTRLGIM